MRVEKDFLGEVSIPAKALFGIHSARAADNFPNTEPFELPWYEAIGKVKQACYETILNYRAAIRKEHPDLLEKLRIPEIHILEAMYTAAIEISIGDHFKHFIVPAIQGGAGTSINMNINEIIANRALQIIGAEPGKYSIIDPIETANLFQSTNDVVPTGLTIAIMKLLTKLEDGINTTRLQTETLENRYRDTLRLCYTQMQEAVPGTYGQLFSIYNDAFSRDWWRVSKASERIKQVNLGGGATGTGIAIPRYFIMEVIPNLRKITSQPLAQGENLPDITANFDRFTEVHAILKAHAVNLEKIANDIRLLASDINGKEILLPARQAGSSIMPGKINPVIPEFIISSAHEIYANDQMITTLSGQGTLDLNAYLPSIGRAMIRTLKLLISANRTLKENMLNEIHIDPEAAAQRLFKSPSVTTAISPLVGYNNASKLANKMREENLNIFQANDILKILPTEKLNTLMQPGYLLKKGFTARDIRDFNDEEQ